MPRINNFAQKNLDKNVHHGIEKRYNYIFNSNNGTLLRGNDDKSLFNVSFTNTISFPEDASSIQIALHSANVYNNVQNITDTLYNTITFILNGTNTQTLTLPPGSYTACDIQTTINSLLEIAYTGITPVPKITLLANNATQKLSIRFDIAGLQIDWGASTIGFILGFTTSDIQPIPASTAGQVIEADSVANINWAITNFLIVCPELVGDGLPLNNVGRGIIGGIPILASPGSLIAYEAINLVWIQCDFLRGQNISSLNFQLTNERLDDIKITDNYNFVVVIKIEY